MNRLVHAAAPTGTDLVAPGLTHPARPKKDGPAGRPPVPVIADDAFKDGSAGTILRPGLWGLNDHTFFRDTAGRIHIVGIRDPFNNPKLFHAVADDWTGPFEDLPPIPRAPGEVGMWAPGAIVRDGRIYIFYTDPRGFFPWRWTDQWSINLVTAPADDPLRWTHCGPLFEGRGHIRDPMVFYDEGTGLYLVYYHRTAEGGTDSSVSFRTSEDLETWSTTAWEAVSGLASDLPGGCAESPHVFHRHGWHYLLVTHTSRRHYTRTRVWASPNPFWFGGPEEYITELWAHAPEVITADGGRWLITHAGHRLHALLNAVDRRFRTPGIQLAELLWE
ncbi:family 43 glycosylhydrolase [Thermodesulfobacteriota bacterium]